MIMKQISVFVENKRGRLAEITMVLANGGINIRALSIADTKEFGILRIIVDNPDKAIEVLKNDGFTVSITKVIAIAVEDKPGGLARAMDVLNQNGISVEYMYDYVSRSAKSPCVIMRVEDNDKATEILGENGFDIMNDVTV